MTRSCWWSLALFACAGCGSPAAPPRATATAVAGPSCGPMPASGCSSGDVTYEQIQPIVRDRCLHCHDGNGEAGPENDFSTRDAIHVHRAGIAARVNRCIMPPPGAPQPSARERTALVEWASCPTE